MAKRRLTVQMEDEMLHTVEQPICNDPGCICAPLEYEQMFADLSKRQGPRPRQKRTLLEKDYTSATLNYRNRGFRLLK